MSQFDACSVLYAFIAFAFSALTLLIGWQEGHQACKNRVVGCWCGCLSGPVCVCVCVRVCVRECVVIITVH